MRLEDRDDALPRAGARGLEVRADFGGMVGVVIDHRHPTGAPAHLKASLHSTEAAEVTSDILDREPGLEARGRARKRV